jgi:hypothetical protein
MSYPPGLQILQEELWRLPEGDLKAFWWALTRARFVRPLMWRQQLGLVGTMRMTEHGLGQLCHPPVLMAVIEALCLEGQLRRSQATRLEETMLAHIQANGHWHGDPAPGAAWARWHAPDIVTLADCGKST